MKHFPFQDQPRCKSKAESDAAFNRMTAAQLRCSIAALQRSKAEMQDDKTLWYLDSCE